MQHSAPKAMTYLKARIVQHNMNDALKQERIYVKLSCENYSIFDVLFFTCVNFNCRTQRDSDLEICIEILHDLDMLFAFVCVLLKRDLTFHMYFMTLTKVVTNFGNDSDYALVKRI